MGEALIRPDTVVFTLTGIYPLQSAPGWRVLLDLTLSTSEEHMPKDVRIDKILLNMGGGDFAKVCQRVRAILPKTKKREFAAAVNTEVGQLRFVVKQLKFAA